METYDFVIELANGNTTEYEGIYGVSYEEALSAVEQYAYDDGYDVLSVYPKQEVL